MWLVFTDANQGRWWARFLEPGFGHVSILILLHGQWTLIRPLYGFTDVVSCPYQEGDIPQTMICDQQALIIPVERDNSEDLRGLVGLQTCVSTAKALMGVRWPWIITPYQLYKRCTTYYAGQNHSTGCPHSGSEHIPRTEKA